MPYAHDRSSHYERRDQEQQRSNHRRNYRMRAFFSIVYGSCLLCSCEWKPPRRPIKLSQSSDESRARKGDLGVSIQALEVDQGPSLEVKAETTAKTTAETTISLSENGQEALQKEVGLEEQLAMKDELLTIDPDGPPLIHLKELTIAKGVASREPRGARRVFRDKEREVLAFLRVRNFERVQKIQLAWTFQGEVIQRDRLKVGISPRWRTWSTLRFDRQAKRYGEWRLEVSTGDGKLIGVTHFMRR